MASARSASIFSEILRGALKGIKANLVKNGRFKTEVIMFARTLSLCTTQTGNMADLLQCLFQGQLNFVMQQLFCEGSHYLNEFIIFH